MKKRTYDVLGIFSASLCLIHCVAFPLLLFIPLSVSHNAFIDLVFLLLGIWSAYKVTRCNVPLFLKYLIWISIILIFLSVLFDLLYHIHTLLVHIGAIGLIIAHIVNYKHHNH